MARLALATRSPINHPARSQPSSSSDATQDTARALEDGSSRAYVLAAAAGNWQTCGAEGWQGLLSPPPTRIGGDSGAGAVPTRSRGAREHPGGVESRRTAAPTTHYRGTSPGKRGVRRPPDPQGNRAGRLTCFR